MATAEEANEFLGGLAASVDDALAMVAPTMTFAVVFWVKGQPDNPKSVAIFGAPEYRGEQPEAFSLASALMTDLNKRSAN